MIDQLREKYQKLVGKRPFPGWDEKELEKRIKEFEGASNEETVEVRKDELKGLLARIEQLEKRNVAATDRGIAIGQKREIKDTDPERKATLKKWRKNTDEEWAWATDWKHLRYDIDPQTRERIDIYKITFTKAGGETFTEEMSLSDFAKIKDRDVVTIKKVSKKKYEEIVGETRRVSVDDSYRVVRGGKVPMKVVTEERVCDIELPNGEIISLNQNRLNA